MFRIHKVCLLVLLTPGIGCTPVQDRDSNSTDENLGPIIQESRDVLWEVSEDGVIRLRLNAGRMLRYDDPDSLYTSFQGGDDSDDRVTAAFFDSLGNLAGTLSAASVRFNESDHTMIATGDVVVESDDGLLKSEEVHWNEDERRISAPGFVSLTTEDENLQGYELEANEDLSKVKIYRITGTFRVREQ